MIKVGSSFKLGADSLNVILYERHIGKKGESKGEEVWRKIAYFSNPQNALKYLVDYEVRKTGLEDVKTVCQKIDELYALINDLRPILTSVGACKEALER